MGVRVVERATWEALEEAHARRVAIATQAHRDRRQQGRPHPVEDFLFTYYPFRPAQLRRWHPGPGVRLQGAAERERAQWRFHRMVGPDVELDTTAYLEARSGTVDFVRRLVSATHSRAAQLGCFGLHEWAMVYRQAEDEVRHAGWPLRLGRRGTDNVVESLQIRCSHFDAFRFYTPPARSLNLLQPTRDTQVAMEQPGCLHAGMDLYKWCMKLSPAIPSELTMDCFELAREIRELDMRASPYDLAALGYAPVPIETPGGRAEYAAAQRGFAVRGQELRQRLLRALEAIGADYSDGLDGTSDGPGSPAGPSSVPAGSSPRMR